MRINILDKSIFTKIAAGEVVEKPASVVKELVENSIDAQATKIVIEIVEGGIKKIKVTDDGFGMSFEDLPKAFMPHATSKIATIEDLEKIGTLGFRGEALSSISSVSKVCAISKTKESEIGSKIAIHGGEIVEHSQIGAPDGTSITVEDLFYCVPARAKFLRKPKQEESEITNIVSRLILANPHLNIKYIVDNKIVFHHLGQGLKEAIYTIYGKNTVDNLIPIEYEKDYFKISGYIGKPTYSKPNRTYQTLLINNRYVINQTISTAVYKAYENFLMKGNFPFYVLNLTLPLDKVDVNVHPNKLDVKFEDSNKIFGLFLYAVFETLFESSHVKELEDNLFTMPKAEPQVLSIDNLNKTIIESTNVLENKIEENEVNEEKLEVKEVTLTDISNNFSEEYENKRKELGLFLNDNSLNLYAKQDFGFSDSLINKALQAEKQQEVKIENIKLFEEDSFKIVGILFATYIVVEQNENVYFIDQHAGHERILYDKFKKQLQERELMVQNLLVPYILDVNYLESEFLINNLQNFKEIGFEIEHFGANSFKVNTVPVLFKDIAIHTFFEGVLKDINNNLTVKPADIIDNYLANSACRSAIKANDILSELEIKTLLNELNKNNQVLLCPHGRPVVVKISKQDFEKWFKRIV